MDQDKFFLSLRHGALLSRRDGISKERKITKDSRMPTASKAKAAAEQEKKRRRSRRRIRR